MKIPNKKAGFNYQIIEKFEVGVVLTGAEVKSLFKGQASLDEAYVKFVGNEVFLLNAHIHPYAYADVKKIDPKRTRKLLMHRAEILSLQTKMKQKNLVLVPLSWYNKGRQVKLEIALARGKKMWEKREALKKADLARETEEVLKFKI
ncbi:SsrA-binding protein [Candidatus Shapirobacteria bacterium CG03_land_8_20_14_0_80_39_12]|uniref:SsrA-binding protein n=1 Tax=Candidatus Shapirobacteria bacterium CG03_land_8_20_14_0_80_39_12 TaxID=1974879 RepID=A0A2M7BF68_9BACT|nr:MAG: SsrA-binding protein [Candidatus Shapirobacteria bacterium CG03_land_8_20_14_0_80_39_12]